MSLLLYYSLGLAIAIVHTTHDRTESITNLGAKIWVPLYSVAWDIKKYLLLKLSITLERTRLDIVLEDKSYY